MAVADLRERNQVTLPPDICRALKVGVGDRLEFRVAEDGAVVVRGLKSVPADQAWFWTPEWQAKEREADIALAEGNFRRFHSVADMDAHLDSLG